MGRLLDNLGEVAKARGIYNPTNVVPITDQMKNDFKERLKRTELLRRYKVEADRLEAYTTEYDALSSVYQHTKPDEIYSLQESIASQNTDKMRAFRQELQRRANPSAVSKGTQMAGGLVEGLLSVPLKMADIVQEFSGQTEDKLDSYVDEGQERTESINRRLKNGTLTQDQANQLRGASATQTSAQLDTYLQGTEWAGLNPDDRLRISAGLGLEAGIDAATFIFGGSLIRAGNPGQAYKIANATGNSARRTQKLADVYRSGSKGRAMLGASETTAAKWAIKKYGSLATKNGLTIEETAAIARKGVVSREAVRNFKIIRKSMSTAKNTTAGGAIGAGFGVADSLQGNEFSVDELKQKATQYGAIGAGLGAGVSLVGPAALAARKGTGAALSPVGKGVKAGVQGLDNTKYGSKITGAARKVGDQLDQFSEVRRWEKEIINSEGKRVFKGKVTPLQRARLYMGKDGALMENYVRRLDETYKRIGGPTEQKAASDYVQAARVLSETEAGLLKTAKQNVKRMSKGQKSKLQKQKRVVQKKLTDLQKKAKTVNNKGELKLDKAGNKKKAQLTKELAELNKVLRAGQVQKPRGSVVTPKQEAKATADLARLRRTYGQDTLDGWGKEINDYSNSLLDDLMEAGLISRKDVARFKKNKNYYAKLEIIEKLQDDIADASTAKVKGAKAKEVVYQRKGYSDEATVLDSKTGQTRQSIAANEMIFRNKVGEAVYGLRDTDFVKVLDSKKATVPDGWKEVSMYKADGKTVRMAIPEKVANSFDHMTPQHVDGFSKMMGNVGRILRKSVTEWRPIFVMLKNPQRDFKNMLINSRTVPVRRSIDRWVDGLMEGLLDKEGYRLFKQKGGGQSGMIFGGSDQLNAAKIAKDIGTKKRPIGAVHNPYQLYKRVGEAIENAPRVAEFKGGLKKGWTPEKAAVAGREVTVDFAQGGAAAKVANLWVPFLNARAQGVRRLGIAFKENPARALSMYAATTVLPIAATLNHNVKNHPDIWNSIRDYEKQNNFILILSDRVDENGDPMDVLKFPKAEIDKALGTPFEQAFLNLLDQPHFSLAGTIIESISQASPVAFSRDGTIDPLTIASNAPPLFQAAGEPLANIDSFTGAPIVSDDLKGLPNEEQYRDNTPWISKQLGKVTGRSPLMIDNILQNLSGPASKYLSDPRTVAQEFEKATMEARTGQANSDFWETKNRMDEIKYSQTRKINEMAGSGNIQAAQRMAKEYNESVEDAFDFFYDKHFDSLSGSEIDYNDIIDGLKISEQYKYIRTRGNNYNERNQ